VTGEDENLPMTGQKRKGDRGDPPKSNRTHSIWWCKIIFAMQTDANPLKVSPVWSGCQYQITQADPMPAICGSVSHTGI